MLSDPPIPDEPAPLSNPLQDPLAGGDVPPTGREDLPQMDGVNPAEQGGGSLLNLSELDVGIFDDWPPPPV